MDCNSFLIHLSASSLPLLQLVSFLVQSLHYHRDHLHKKKTKKKPTQIKLIISLPCLNIAVNSHQKSRLTPKQGQKATYGNSSSATMWETIQYMSFRYMVNIDLKECIECYVKDGCLCYYFKQWFCLCVCVVVVFTSTLQYFCNFLLAPRPIILIRCHKLFVIYILLRFVACSLIPSAHPSNLG